MKKISNREKALELREKGYKLKAIAHELELSISTVSRLLNAQDSPVDTKQFTGITWDKYGRRYLVRLKGETVGSYKHINDAVYYRNKRAVELWGYTRAAKYGYLHDPITLRKMED